jgi:hypothetical protein
MLLERISKLENMLRAETEARRRVEEMMITERRIHSRVANEDRELYLRKAEQLEKQIILLEYQNQKREEK